MFDFKKKISKFINYFTQKGGKPYIIILALRVLLIRFFRGTSFLYWLVVILTVFVTVHWIHGTFIFDRGRLDRFYHPRNYAPFPYIMFKGEPNSGGYNNIGYKGSVPSKEKDNTFRIFVLGGSSVALGNPPFSEQLEEIFHKKGYGKVRVFNFGAMSSMLGQDVVRILYEVVDFHPNLIVMYSGFNDLNHPFYTDPRPGYPFNFMIHESNPLSSKSFRSFPWTLLLYRSSILRQFFPNFFYRQFTNIQTLRSQVGYGTEKWKKQIVDAYWNYVGKAKKIAEAYESNLLVVFQAVVYGKTLHLNEKSFVKERKRNDWNFMFKYLIRSAHKREDVSFFDRSGIFDHISEQVFVDQEHIKQAYRRHVAQELFKIIIQYDPPIQLY